MCMCICMCMCVYTLFEQKVGYVGKFRTLTLKISAQRNVRPRLPGHIGRPPGGLPNGTTPVSRAPRIADFSSKFGPKFARPWSTATKKRQTHPAEMWDKRFHSLRGCRAQGNPWQNFFQDLAKFTAPRALITPLRPPPL